MTYPNKSKFSARLSVGQKISLIVLCSTFLTLSIGFVGSHLVNNVLFASKRSYLAAKVSEYVGQVTTNIGSFLHLAHATVYRAGTSPSERLAAREDLELTLAAVGENILGLSGQAADLDEIRDQAAVFEKDWKLVEERGHAWLKALDGNSSVSTLAKELASFEAAALELSTKVAGAQSKSSKVISESYSAADRADQQVQMALIGAGILISLVVLSSILIGRSISKSCIQLVTKVHEKASTLLGTSSTLSSGSQKLSESSSEQSAAIQESMSAMEEMSSMIASTTQYAEECNRITSTVDTKTKAGVSTMREMVGAMDSIEESNMSLSEISGIIEKIFERTAVIDDIVFKTQLLSFNASIEAARAGQYGKGFAVVAEEVGKLAESSGAAAKEISGLLAASRKEVSRIVEETTRRVRDGKNVSQNAMEAFNQITQDINSIAEQVADISRAAKEQTLGVKQVGAAMHEMDRASQQNNGVAHDVARLSQGMKSDCDDFAQIVQAFRTVILGAGKARQLENLPSEAQKPSANSSRELDLGQREKDGSQSLGALIDIIAAKAKDPGGKEAEDKAKTDKQDQSKRSA